MNKHAQCIFVAAALLAAKPVTGHHSEAAFDSDTVVAFTGTVTNFSWRNPHVYIDVATTLANGQQIEWQVETGATPLLARSGWSQDSLAQGDEVTVRAHPSREPERRYALLLSLEKEDGTVLEQALRDAESTASAADLSGVWKGSPPGYGGFLQQFDSIPLTAKGAAARDRYDMFTENPAAGCIAYPSPSIVVAGFAFLTEIEVDADVVVMRNEWFDAERTIFMDGRAHPVGGERTIQGHSIGWWEDETLVVDTTHFADHRAPYQNGVPSGAQKHVIERYTLTEDGRRIQIDILLEDPEYLAEPFTTTVEWNYRPDLRLLRFDCDLAVSSQFAH